MPIENITGAEASGTSIAHRGLRAKLNAIIDALNAEGAANAKPIVLQVSNPNGADLATGDGQAFYRIPSVYDGYELVGAAARITTTSSSGNPEVMLRRQRAGASVDMLSTPLTIDATEYDSATAATPAVINTSNDDLEEADAIFVDVDAAGTNAKGLQVTLLLAQPSD